MAIQIICPNLRCRKLLSVPDDVRGKVVKCQGCETTFKIPEHRPKPAPVQAPQK